MIKNIPVRFYIVDYELEDNFSIVEVSELDFNKAPGQITYERHTIRENGVSQICLTKGLDS